jgi:hypothetical protein
VAACDCLIGCSAIDVVADTEMSDIEASGSVRYSAACATFMRPAASSTDLTML